MESKSPARKSLVVPCPTCGGNSIYGPENSWRPFCGARCKQIDFGAWASEDFRVALKGYREDSDSTDPDTDHSTTGGSLF